MLKICSLLFLMLMSLPLHAQRFVDVTTQIGIDSADGIFRTADVYNTGLEDLIALSGQPLFGSSGVTFYHNVGSGFFQNVSAVCGLDLSDTLIKVTDGTGMLFYDYDKDGYKDVLMGARRDNGAYVLAWGSINGFNMLDTTTIDTALNDIAFQSHLPEILDINQDGYLDFVFSQKAVEPNRPNRVRYFLNNGNRTFRELFNPPPPPPPPIIENCNIGFARDTYQGPDYNSDGVEDFYAREDVGSTRRFLFAVGTGKAPNRPCYIPDTLKWVPSLPDTTKAYHLFADYDFNNDGFLDFVFTRGASYPYYPPLFWQHVYISVPQANRKPTYVDILPDSFSAFQQNPFQFIKVTDFDSNGSLDIYGFWDINIFETSKCYYKNLLPAGDGAHNFLKVKLEGTLTNREGIGSKVVIVNSDTTGGKWWRQMRLNSDGRVLHFGLGSAQIVDSVYVNWANGRKDLIRNVAANQTITIQEGSSQLSTEIGEEKPIPSFILEQNYPNPFNPTTVIRYALAVASEVKLEIFDVLGRKVAILVNATQQAGAYSFTVNTTTYNLSSGVYFYRLQTNDMSGRAFIQTKKMLLLK